MTLIDENAAIATDTEVPAANVVEALRRVMRDLPAIGKDQRADKSMGGYAYRGLEQITREVQPLLVRHGVVMLPTVLDAEIREVTVGGKPWTDTILRVAYTVCGPGGPEDTVTVGPLVGIGRDGSDKGANKAMSQAFKYALLQTFCIADEKDDADQGSHEADQYSQTARAGQPRGPEPERTPAGNTRRGPIVKDGWVDIDEQRGAHDAYSEKAEADLDEEGREALKAWRKEKGFGWPMTATEMEQAVAFMDLMIESQALAKAPATPDEGALI